MNRKRKMTAAATANEIGNVKHFPGLGILDNETDDPAVKHPFWVQRAVDLQLTTMAAPTKPYWNPTMVSAWCAVVGVLLVLISMVVGLWYFTWQTALAEGIQRGKTEVETQQLKERLAVAEDAARRSELFEASKSGQVGHENSNTEKKK